MLLCLGPFWCSMLELFYFDSPACCCYCLPLLAAAAVAHRPTQYPSCVLETKLQKQLNDPHTSYLFSAIITRKSSVAAPVAAVQPVVGMPGMPNVLLPAGGAAHLTSLAQYAAALTQQVLLLSPFMPKLGLRNCLPFPQPLPPSCSHLHL